MKGPGGGREEEEPAGKLQLQPGERGSLRSLPYAAKILARSELKTGVNWSVLMT